MVHLSKKVSVVVIVVIIAGSALGFWAISNIYRSQIPSGSNIKSASDSPTNHDDATSPIHSSATQATSENKSTNDPAAAGNDANFVLIIPTGNFVSNHTAFLNSKPHFNLEQSVCTTTSGATCQISFTNTVSGVTKSLKSQMTDEGGSAYWTWKLQDVGLTAGSWKVTAVARHGSQVESATDPTLLEVQQ